MGSVQDLCGFCVTSVLSLCRFCVGSVQGLCGFCVISVLSQCRFCVGSVQGLCGFCVASILGLYRFSVGSIYVIYRVFNSDLIYFESLDDHQICNQNIVFRLSYKAEMWTFMKM